MPAPSPLQVAAKSVERLLREEASYAKELVQQQAKVEELAIALAEAGDAADENQEFMLNQHKKAIDETKAVFAPLRLRLAEALHKLEDALRTAGPENDSSVPAADREHAQQVLAQGRQALAE